MQATWTPAEPRADVRAGRSRRSHRRDRDARPRAAGGTRGSWRSDGRDRRRRRVAGHGPRSAFRARGVRVERMVRSPATVPAGSCPSRHRVADRPPAVCVLRASASAPSSTGATIHLFTPLLYQVATGALSPGDIAQPLRSILRKQRNTTVLLGEAVGHRPRAPRGPPRRTAARSPTTRSIVATGRASHRTSTTTSGRRSRPGLKTLDDATEIRRRILIAFEAAEREHDPDRRARRG